jgi:hypothetical protein
MVNPISVNEILIRNFFFIIIPALENVEIFSFFFILVFFYHLVHFQAMSFIVDINQYKQNIFLTNSAFFKKINSKIRIPYFGDIRHL